MQRMWKTAGKRCGRPKMDRTGLKQNFNQLPILLGETFQVLMKAECQLVATNF